MKQFLISSLLFLSSVMADQSVAVLDFTGEGLTQNALDSLSESLRMELLRFDTLKVLDRDEMNQVLSGYNISDCPSYDCAVVAGLILKVNLLVNTQILKVGEVFVVQSQLYDPPTGRAINTVTYDRENSLEGLLSRGMKNVALMLLTQRIPLTVHQAEEMVYIHTRPAGAWVIVGRDTLSELTPVALKRVTVESNPITVTKDNFKKFTLNKLPPKDASRVIFLNLSPLHPVPKIGNVLFKDRLPAGIFLVPKGSATRLTIAPKTKILRDLKTGSYHLESDIYVIKGGSFKIYPQRTTRLKVELIKREMLKAKRRGLKLKRNLLITGAVGSTIYRGYLQYTADKNYQAYRKDSSHPEKLRTLVEDQDRLKPYIVVLSGSLFLPAVYYHLQIFKIDKLLSRP